MSWQSELWKQSRTENSNQGGLDKPYASRVASVSPQNERAIIKNYSTKSRSFPIPHPFISLQSWIRAIPENGTNYLTFTRADSNVPQMTSTFFDDSAGRINSYTGGVGIYRPLFPGEIEISSLGNAQTYYSRRPIMSSKAGVIERTMNQDTLKVLDRAPIHHQTFLTNQNGVLGDEHKIGIVERYRNSWKKFYPKLNDQFTAEEYLELKNPAGSSPTTLFRMQRGHVLDAQGTPINHTVTSLPLRYQEIYFTNDDTDTRHEIDELGNYLVALSPAAADGFQLNVPNGNAIYRIEKDWKADIVANRTTTIGGTDLLDISGARKVIVAEDTKYQTANYYLKSDDLISMEGKSLDVQMQSGVKYVSQGSMSFESLGAAQFAGLGGTNLGNAASATVVNGATVGLAGGGLPVARVGDKITGNTLPFGLPVVGLVATGSPKVTSG